MSTLTTSSSASNLITPLTPPHKHHHYWPGNNYFLCGGRIMLGSSIYVLVFTVGFEGGMVALVGKFVSPYLHWLYTIIFIILSFLSLLFLLLVSFTDAGIIPRCTAPPQTITPAPPVGQSDYNGDHLKYCDTCHLFRRGRAKHCRYCNNCVKEFDHRELNERGMRNCAWLGSCIGRRNYRYFLLYITATFTLCLYVISMILQVLSESALNDHHDERIRVKDVLDEHPVLLIMGVLLCGISLSLFLLILYHLNLIRLGETTNENIRGVFKRHINIYNKGFIANFKRIWIDVPESELDYLTEDVTSDSIPGLAPNVDVMNARRNCANETTALIVEAMRRSGGNAGTNGTIIPSGTTAAAAAARTVTSSTNGVVHPRGDDDDDAAYQAHMQHSRIHSNSMDHYLSESYQHENGTGGRQEEDHDDEESQRLQHQKHQSTFSSDTEPLISIKTASE